MARGRIPSYPLAIGCPVCRREDADRHVCSFDSAGRPRPSVMCRWYDCPLCHHRSVLRLKDGSWVVARSERIRRS